MAALFVSLFVIGAVAAQDAWLHARVDEGSEDKSDKVLGRLAAVDPPTASTRGSAENPYLVPEARGAIKIDGVLDEESWATALTLELPYEIIPGENTPAVVRTEALVTYDSHNLYVAFRCYDPDPSAIRARLTDREQFFGDDHVHFQIDTFNDERRFFLFGANPKGVQQDFVYYDEQFDRSWDAIFDAAAKIVKWGYIVEFAVPFNQFRFQRTEGEQTWGFDAWRIYPRSVERNFAVVPRDRNNNCLPCQMAKIKGFRGVRSGKNIELVPTLTAVRTDARNPFPAGSFEKRHQEIDTGITGQWGVTPNLILSGALNPDFSQVEADARQLDINTPFALSYAEKRPFFVEGVAYFRSPLVNAVYTRSIRDPLWGAKISGKEGANSLGGFVVEDEVTNVILPSIESSRNATLPGSSYASVFRYKRDLGNRYSVGALVTSREGQDYFNRVYGADGDFRLTDKDRFTLQWLGSTTRYPADFADRHQQPRGSFTDGAMALQYAHQTRSVYWSTEIADYGEDFRADLGFEPQVGGREYYGELGYQWVPEKDTWFTSISVEGEYEYLEDDSGRPVRRTGDVHFWYLGPLQSQIGGRIYKRRESFNGREFDILYYGGSASFIPNQSISAGLSTSFGNMIDYANTQLGDRVGLYPYLDLKLGDHLEVDLEYTYEQLDVPGGRLYTADILQGTVIYQLNVRTFIRSILQYVDYRYSPDLYTLPREPEFRQLFTQFLFSYKINPRTVLFMGYSDNYYAGQGYDLTQADRSFFAKVGYSWQF